MCEAKNCTGDGFNAPNAGIIIGCLSRGNGGIGFDVSYRSIFVGCLAYDNTGDGFEGKYEDIWLINCLAVNNGGYGFDNDDKEIFIQYHLEPPKEIPKPVGCESCHHTGYSGRTAIYEIVTVDRNMKELIFAEALHSVIEDQAVQQGTSLFPKQALKKVVNQITTLEEVHRIIAIS